MGQSYQRSGGKYSRYLGVMDAIRYRLYLEELTEIAESALDVVGLVVLGSGAAVSREPDGFSDHDVWLITSNGNAERWRNSAAWLPWADQIVGHLADSQHARSVVYGDGHLVELAVFDLEELDVVSANEYAVLYDAGGIGEEMAAIAARTAAHRARPSASYARDRFVVQLLIGLGRFGRGETMSANQMIREFAAMSLVHALTGDIEHEAIDSLDPHRRVEQVIPVASAEVAATLGRPLIETARGLAAIAVGQGVLDAAEDAELLAALRPR